MAYSLVAVDFLPNRAVQSALRRLSADLGSGALRPMPQVVHSLDSVQAALRQMSQARHVGKIVVRADTLQQNQGPAKVRPSGCGHSSFSARQAFRAHTCSQGTVVVTGGLGMIGSLVGAWLARQPVANVVLLGRSGRPGPDAAPLAQLLLAGCAAMVHLTRCDAGSADEVAASAAAACGSGHLQGVIHSGGVLADATLPNQTLGGVRTVFAPKVTSAQLWQPRVALQPAPMHVAFSSVAALLGSPGQANYAAANALLDALAGAWRAQVRLHTGSTLPGACSEAYQLHTRVPARRGKRE